MKQRAIKINPALQIALLSCLMLLLLIYPLQLMAKDAPAAEYKLKAALLYKLTQFVEWPNSTIYLQERSFGICVLGENLFGSSLDALQKRSVFDRKISVHYYEQSDEVIGHCDLVFISHSKKPYLKKILRKLKKYSILSISDIENFAERGGIIQFTSGKRIGFKINIETAKNCGLKIAAPLLQLSKIVGSKGN
ncbi:MAG: YfiR family protein [Gammaproteobacteria bacterium]|nr:YfiR family protein [Gammaproteobacteria bacterium]